MDGRAEKILTATGDNQHPVYKAFLQRKQTVKVECVETRPCGKRPGTNVGREYEITQQERFRQLVKEKPGHDWQWDGLNLRCGQCQLKLTHTKNRKNLQALAEHACTQQGRVHVEGVHAAHVLKLHGVRQLWVCEGCGGQMSLSTKLISQKLSVACAVKKHPRCKTHFPTTTSQTLRSPFQQTGGLARVGQEKPHPPRSSLSRE